VSVAHIMTNGFFFWLSGNMGTLRNECFITFESGKRLLSSFNSAPTSYYDAFNKSTPTVNIELAASVACVLASSTQVRGLKPGRSRRSFRGEKSPARLPSEGK
jgi:hypothetical protein